MESQFKSYFAMLSWSAFTGVSSLPVVSSSSLLSAVVDVDTASDVAILSDTGSAILPQQKVNSNDVLIKSTSCIGAPIKELRGLSTCKR